MQGEQFTNLSHSSIDLGRTIIEKCLTASMDSKQEDAALLRIKKFKREMSTYGHLHVNGISKGCLRQRVLGLNLSRSHDEERNHIENSDSALNAIV